MNGVLDHMMPSASNRILSKACEHTGEISSSYDEHCVEVSCANDLSIVVVFSCVFPHLPVTLLYLVQVAYLHSLRSSPGESPFRLEYTIQGKKAHYSNNT